MIHRLRSVRIPIGGKSVAVFDLAATGIFGYAMSRFFHVPLPVAVIGAFAVGHVTHKVLRVQTAFS